MGCLTLAPLPSPEGLQRLQKHLQNDPKNTLKNAQKTPLWGTVTRPSATLQLLYTPYVYWALGMSLNGVDTMWRCVLLLSCSASGIQPSPHPPSRGLGWGVCLDW